ncbi:MAG TPA: hypothetical protein VF791_11525 [Pyrinomonadaceae bacterium]
MAQKKSGPERCLVEDCLVRDGVGIENIAVGRSSLRDVVARFGNDYELIDHNKYSYEARYFDLRLSFYYRYGDEHKKIFVIDIRPPFRGVTESGIVLGKSTLGDVEGKYWPSKFSSTAASDTYSFDYPGIEFHVEADKSLRKITYEDKTYLRKRVAQIVVNMIDPQPAPAGMRATPTEISRGPVLFFDRAEEVSGKRMVSHYVVDPEVSQTPRLFLAADDDSKPWHRFNQHEFLMGSSMIPSDLFFLNVKTGAMTPLLEGGSIDLYKVDGDKVFFVEEENDDRGFAPNAEKIKAEKPQTRHTRHRLYVFDRTSPSYSKLVTKESLLHVLAVDEKYCWVVVDRARPELWRITKDGQEQKKIALIKDDWIFSLEDAAASPDGSLLALGVNDGREMWMRTLVVIDVATGRTVFKSPKINVLESGERKFDPELKFVWLDNSRVRFSETAGAAAGRYFRWVDLDVRTGKRLGEQRYGEFAYEHVRPSKDSLDYTKHTNPWTHGLFVKNFPHLLYFKGDTEPVGDLRNDQFNTDIEISVEGEWAVFSGPKTGAYLADGVRRTKNRLAPDGINFTWMPALRDVR